MQLQKVSYLTYLKNAMLSDGVHANFQLLRRTLARLKRKILSKPYIKSKKYPAYWFNLHFSGRGIQVVQIGSNDGRTGDPLYQLLQKNKKWKALFVEPVPAYFEKLKSNYGSNPRFRFENVAITRGESLTFYMISPQAAKDIENLPFWCEQLGSFHRKQLEMEFEGRLEPYIVPISVQCVSLSGLFEQSEIDACDILHIDAEGHDWIILQQLDLLKYRPDFILFERNHLKEEDLLAARFFLQKDFVVFGVGIDALAVRVEGNERMIEEMKKHMSPGF